MQPVAFALALLASVALLLCPSGSLGQSPSSTQTLYWSYSITNGTSTFGAWSVCASGSLVASTAWSSSNTLALPAFTVYNISGQRVFTNSAGSTVQNILGLLGNDNANLAADDLLYVDPPWHVDGNGIAYLLDGPVVYGNGVYQYANLTIWPQSKVESYSPPGISSGLQVSPSASAFTCSVQGNLVWAFSYTLQGNSGGQAFTICTTGLLTTSQASTVSGQQVYSVVSATGSRQVTIGSDLTASGNTINQQITGIAPTSTSNAANTLQTSSPYLTSGGISLQLSSAAQFPAGPSSNSFVNVQLSSGVVSEQGGVSASSVTSNSGFLLSNSQTYYSCPATLSFSFCFYTQSSLPSDTAAASSSAGVWNVASYGTFQTGLALQLGGNHPNPGAYTALAQYYVLTNISGTRVQNSAAGTVTNSITGLAGLSVDYEFLADNRVYTTYPFLDEYGLLYTLNSNVVQPGGIFGSTNVINLYGPQPIEGDAAAAFASFTYQSYTPGAALPACSLSSLPVKTLSFQYTTSSTGSLLSWSSCVSATVTVLGPYPTIQSGRNAYTVINATGSRVYTINGVSATQQIIGVTDDIGDQTIYDQYPYSIYEGGIGFLLDSPATFPGVNSAYNVLYIGNPSNTAYTIETNYETNYTSGIVNSISISAGTSSYVCPTNPGGTTAPTLTFSWSYTVTSPAANSTFGTWSVCASGLVTVSNTLLSINSLAAYPIVAFNGTRVFTNAQGSTVQVIQSLLGNDNANLAADNYLYVVYPFLDVNGIAFFVDSPVIYANGPYQYANVTLWPLSYRNIVESYSPSPQVSTGFQVSTGSAVATCPLAAQRVWTWSYTLSGTSNGQSFTICAAGLITTSSSLTSSNGQQAYSVLAINGTRQVTIAGSTTLQTITGLGASSVDGADNVVLSASPYLTSGGITLLLNSNAVYASGSSSSSFVTVQLSNGALIEKAGAAASSVSSNSGFLLASSQSVPQCPATQAWSFCYASQGQYSTGQPWSVTAYGTFTTPIATQSGGNHEDGAYLPSGSYYTLTSISGTRVQTNTSGTFNSQIVGLASVSASYNYLADNRIWTTFPWLSEYGWLYQLNTPVLFPAAESLGPNTLINLCEATPVEYSSPLWAFLSYQPYTAGSTVPSCPAAFPTTTISIGYVTSQSAGGLLPWQSCVNAVLTVQGPYSTVVGGRSAYTLISATGTRVFTVNGVSTTQQIIGTSSVDLFDNNIYTATPFTMQFGGFALLLNGNAVTSQGNSSYNVLAVTNTDGTNSYETTQDGIGGANTVTSILFVNGANSNFQCGSASFGGSGAGGSSLSGGAIAGIVIGVVVGVLLLVLIAAVVCLKARGGKDSSLNTTDSKSNGHTAANGKQTYKQQEESASRTNDDIELQS